MNLQIDFPAFARILRNYLFNGVITENRIINTNEELVEYLLESIISEDKYIILDLEDVTLRKYFNKGITPRFAREILPYVNVQKFCDIVEERRDYLQDMGNDTINDNLVRELFPYSDIEVTAFNLPSEIAKLFQTIIVTAAQAPRKQRQKDNSELKQNTVSLTSTPTVVPKPIFCGRDDMVKRISDHFCSGERILFLYGIGGIGKTQIAKQYAKQYKNNYDVIVYATYNGSIVDLISSEKDFKLTLPIPKKILADGTTEGNEDYFKRKIEKINDLSTPRTLIIIDNFDVESDDYLPALMDGKYHLLITTRCDYTRLYPCIQVKEIEDVDDLVDIFMHNYNGYAVKQDDPDLVTLIELVNRHTYTVELLALHMENSGQTASEMISELKKAGITSLNETVHSDDMKYRIAYENLLKRFRVFSLSGEQKQILISLSLMPLDGVFVEDFRNWTELNSDKHIRVLEKRSWIINNNGKITLHPIIREVVRHEFGVNFSSCNTMIDNLRKLFRDTSGTKAEDRIYYGKIAQVLCDERISMRYEDAETYFAILNLFIYLDMYDLAEKLIGGLSNLLETEKTEITARFYFHCGDYYLRRMQYEKAVESLLISQRINKEISPVSFELSYVTKHLAHAYHAMYEHKKQDSSLLENASICLKESRDVFNKLNGEQLSSFMGSQWYAEGLNHYYRGRYPAALECAKKSLDIFLEINGEDHSDTTAPIRTLARIYSKMGLLQDAVEMQKRSIKIRESLWGRNHFKYFAQLETLADIYFENGKLDEAKMYLEKVIELIGERAEEFELYIDKIRGKIKYVSNEC